MFLLINAVVIILTTNIIPQLWKDIKMQLERTQEKVVNHQTKELTDMIGDLMLSQILPLSLAAKHNHFASISKTKTQLIIILLLFISCIFINFIIFLLILLYFTNVIEF